MKTERLLYILGKLNEGIKFNKNSLGVIENLNYIRKSELISDEEHSLMVAFFEKFKPTPDNRYKEFYVNPISFLNCSVLHGKLLFRATLNDLRLKYIQKVIYDVKQNSITTGRKISILKKVKNLISAGHIEGGICCAIDKLYHTNKITYLEHKIITAFINHNKPTADNEYKEFIISPFWIGTGYWWNKIERTPQTKRIRLNYLKKLISNIK